MFQQMPTSTASIQPICIHRQTAHALSHEVFPLLIFRTNCSSVSASAPLASAVNAVPVRDLRYTTMRRVARSPVARASDSIGAAIDGCTVFDALASTSQKRALDRGTTKSISSPC